MNGSNESVKFGLKIDFKILMDRISKSRPDHDMALVDIPSISLLFSERSVARSLYRVESVKKSV